MNLYFNRFAFFFLLCAKEVKLEQKKDVAIVVLYFNKLRLTIPCIRSILESGYSPHRVYCFDNGSQPGIFQELNSEFPLCKHLRIEENRGYSGGFNRALEWAFSEGFSSALFCANDTIVNPGAAEACIQTAENTNAGMVAPLVTYLSRVESVDSIGAYFDARTGTLHHHHEYNLPEILNPQNDYIPGTAVWIKKETFFNLGGANETFHMYWEDVDMCFRAHRKGIPLARCYAAVIRHRGGQTCRKKPLYTTFYFQRNRIRFCRSYLHGDNLDTALRMIRKELMDSGLNWKEKGDIQRMGYLEKLLKELD